MSCHHHHCRHHSPPKKILGSPGVVAAKQTELLGLGPGQRQNIPGLEVKIGPADSISAMTSGVISLSPGSSAATVRIILAQTGTGAEEERVYRVTKGNPSTESTQWNVDLVSASSSPTIFTVSALNGGPGLALIGGPPGTDEQGVLNIAFA